MNKAPMAPTKSRMIIYIIILKKRNPPFSRSLQKNKTIGI